jgi:hypothetical protein
VPPLPGVVATRRTALAGAVGSALALAACDGGEPAASPSPTAASTSLAPADPDQALVAQVVAELDELIAFTVAAAAARRAVAAWPAAFETLHRAHRSVLTEEEAQTPATRVRGSAGEVLDRVTRREERARRQLAEWAVAAQSGRLARLLASMSAAVAQQLASPIKAGR